jgi:hypothetical protein
MSRLLLVVLTVCALSNSACTTHRPTEASPEETQQLILSKGLIEPGDRVRLVTADQTVHEFRVTDIDYQQGFVIGKDDRVPIAEIVAAETREVSVGKTALLTGGVGTGVAVLIAIAIAPAIILGGG